MTPCAKSARHRVTTPLRPEASPGQKTRPYDTCVDSGCASPICDASVGANCYRSRNAMPYDGKMENRSQSRTVARSARSPTHSDQSKNPNTTHPVAMLRWQRGYSATNYDANLVDSPASLRRQFGEKYDQKKIRNSKSADLCGSAAPLQSAGLNLCVAVQFFPSPDPVAMGATTFVAEGRGATRFVGFEDRVIGSLQAMLRCFLN